jgi:hypothetical protein
MVSAAAASMASRSPGGGNPNPKTSCSSAFQPAPMPISARPPVMTSRVCRARASITGCRMVTGETMHPSRMRSVSGPSATASDSASSTPSSGWKPATPIR